MVCMLCHFYCCHCRIKGVLQEMKWKVNVWRLEIWRDASCKSLSITLTMLYVLTRRIMGILKHWHSELIFLPQICLLLAVLAFLCVGVAPFREVMSSVTGKSTNWDICEPAGPEHTQVYPHISTFHQVLTLPLLLLSEKRNRAFLMC